MVKPVIYLLTGAVIAAAAYSVGLAAGEDVAPGTSPETRSDPAPIFQCTGAGGGVVVSLGGDGKSIYVYCAEVKS
jgi:hypothetical protein